MNRRWIGLFGFLAILLFISTSAFAQEEIRSQITVQATGWVPKDSTATDASGNSFQNHTTKSGGFLAGYTFAVNKWGSVEGNYGYSQNTQNFASLVGSAGVMENAHEWTGDFLFKIPTHTARLRPFALAGAGILMLHPTDEAMLATNASNQTKGVFVYGAGADFAMSHRFGVRAEYRGLLTKTPDFGLTDLATSATTHIAEPSVGIFYRF
jgi:outer membrane immunogenic protein